MIEIELENCCRTCLRDDNGDGDENNKQQNQRMKLLSSQWNNTLSFADMLTDIITISPHIDDTTLLKICESCENSLITAYNFKIVCRNTENFLLNTTAIPQPIEEIKVESYKNDQCPEVLLVEGNEILQTENVSTKVKEEERDPESNIDGDDGWQDEDMNLYAETIANKKPKKRRGRKPKVKHYEIFDGSKTKLYDKEINQFQDNENVTTTPVLEDDLDSKQGIPVKKRKKYERKKPMTKKDPAEPKEKKKRTRNTNKSEIKPACKFCKRCNIKYESNQAYMQHVKEVHWVASPCTFCGKLFFACHMETHMISHSKEKNHICSLCGSRFSYEYNLKAHMRIHSGEKRYKCDFCDETFIHWNSKKNHMYLKHTREKKYECYICHKKFGQNGGMKTHIRYHTGDLPHYCPFCQKRFPSPYKLRRHIKTHREIPAQQLEPHLQLINPPINTVC